MARFFVSQTLVSLLLLSGCGKSCFESRGERGEKYLALAPFHTIQVSDKFNLVLKQDSVESAVVSGGSHLLDGVRLEVKDSVLTLYDDNTCDWMRDMSAESRMTVEVRLRDLRQLITNGVATVATIDTLNLNFIDIKHHSSLDGTLRLNAKNMDVLLDNSGNLRFEGYSGQCVVSLYDYGAIDARTFTVAYQYLYHYGARDSYVKPKLILGCVFGGTGNLYYYQTPDKFEITEGKRGGKAIKAP